MSSKNIVLSKSELDSNLVAVNDFLTKKGLAAIFGGEDWSSTNYCESTYVRKTVALR